MNGQVKKCDNRKIVEKYIETFNPYEGRPSIDIDLVALTRYAKEQGKEVKELSETEIALFRK